ncbi:putative purine permease 11 [Glycine soja]|uniref:Putative purine permease 11 n=1 Tax=Glycine soja TaxID=3848 RepID=A0A445G740_GLYSO|nr:putative purine permease 11 [Glycine soja]
MQLYPTIIATCSNIVGLFVSGDWKTLEMEMKEFENGNLELTITPFLAFMVFHDKINGVKVIAFLLAIWGFLSYMYQYYLDGTKAKEDKSDDSLEFDRWDLETITFDLLLSENGALSAIPTEGNCAKPNSNRGELR